MGLGAAALTVLAYHEISGRRTPTSVSPRRFAAQMDLMGDLGLAVVPLADAAARGRHGVALTFDDGHLETYSEAFPVLAQRGLVATVYVASGFVSSQNWFEPGGRPMTWGMIRELSDAGWTIGSHTIRHTLLTGVDDRTLAHELNGSRAVLEDALGTPCRHFCAPYGAMDQRVLDAVREAGYATAALSLPARHQLKDAGGVVPRSGIYPGTGWWKFRMKVRGWDLRLRGGDLRRALRRAAADS